MRSHWLRNWRDYRWYSSVINVVCGLTPAVLRGHWPCTDDAVHLLVSPPVSFISPILDKSKAHIALAQLDSAIPNHYCKSHSALFLPPIFLYCRQRINPQCFGKCPGASSPKAPEILHFISTLHLLSPLPAMLLSHSSFSCLFFSIT